MLFPFALFLLNSFLYYEDTFFKVSFSINILFVAVVVELVEQVPSAREHEHEAQRVPRVLGERPQRQRGPALAG